MAHRKTSTATHSGMAKRLVVLAVLIVVLLVSLGAISLKTHKSRWAPDFALDLEGGVQLILAADTENGAKVTKEDINQAIEIMRQRVDASGVSEAEISSQGSNNIIVSLPGNPSEETIELVSTSAVLRMRPVLQEDGAGSLGLQSSIVSEGAVEGGADGTATAPPETQPAEGTGASGDVQATPEATPVEGGSAVPSDPGQDAFASADVNGDGVLSAEPSTAPTDPSDLNWITEQVLYDFQTLDCNNEKARLAVAKKDDPTKPLAACAANPNQFGVYPKYILGPTEVEGLDIKQAVAGYDSQDGKQAVTMQFNSKGTTAVAAMTNRLIGLESPRNEFAIVLDGSVISAPYVQSVIPNGSARISGSFTAESAKNLANQLSFGSLPLNFTVQTRDQVSPTLGSDSLRAGLIAGLIGIILIIIYLMWQYHGLGVVAIGSISLAIGLSYLIVCLLSYLIGMRLSLAGVVALIISIGITADSFIVFFERIRDEQRDGRSNAAAVAHGWQRAKRTVIVADSVNLLAAVVLYFLAVGSVRGFAFMLGLTTILDLIIIFMFTYPAMTLLVRKTAFFGQGKSWSGMDSVALGNESHYKGAGRFVSHSSKSDELESDVDNELEKASELVGAKAGAQLSLAERRAIQRRQEREKARKVDAAVEAAEDNDALDADVDDRKEDQ